MPVNLTDANAFTSPVTAPAGSDPAGRDEIVSGLQVLADRTRYLKNKVDELAAQTKYFGLPSTSLDSGWTRTFTDATSSANSAQIYLPLDFLHVGAEIVSMSALVTPGAADMTLTLRTITHDFSTPATPSSVTTATVNSSGTSLQVVTLTPGSPVTVEASKSYLLTVFANPSAGASPDVLYGLRVVANVKGTL